MFQVLFAGSSIQPPASRIAIARRPASVILTRMISISLSPRSPRSSYEVANPAGTK
jgi:hypothetical protein